MGPLIREYDLRVPHFLLEAAQHTSASKIPIPIFENSTCRVSKGTHFAELLQRAYRLIWDETPMTHTHIFDAVHRTLWDIPVEQCSFWWLTFHF